MGIEMNRLVRAKDTPCHSSTEENMGDHPRRLKRRRTPPKEGNFRGERSLAIFPSVEGWREAPGWSPRRSRGGPLTFMSSPAKFIIDISGQKLYI